MLLFLTTDAYLTCRLASTPPAQRECSAGNSSYSTPPHHLAQTQGAQGATRDDKEIARAARAREPLQLFGLKDGRVGRTLERS
jgi:hypothetical protein